MWVEYDDGYVNLDHVVGVYVGDRDRLSPHGRIAPQPFVRLYLPVPVEGKMTVEAEGGRADSIIRGLRILAFAYRQGRSVEDVRREMGGDSGGHEPPTFRVVA